MISLGLFAIIWFPLEIKTQEILVYFNIFLHFLTLTRFLQIDEEVFQEFFYFFDS